MVTWRKVRTAIMIDIDRSSEGATLHPDSHYAKQLGCTITTVKRAMADLANGGFIQRRKGAKTVVVSKRRIIMGNEYSFASTATQIYGQPIETRIVEQSLRLPNPGYFNLDEAKAQRELALKRTEPFFIMSRLRLLNDAPRAMHRSYINPKLFPETFLSKHDFRESLVNIYYSYGFTITSRRTVLTAAMPTTFEIAALNIEKDAEPVLCAEQWLYATHGDSEVNIVLEYLRATYLEWEYTIEDRLGQNHKPRG